MQMPDEKAQQRNLSITTYQAGPGKAVIRGRLVDRRFKEIFLVNGERRPVGIVHDITLQILIDMANLTIEDIEVELVEVPRMECMEIKNSLSTLKGVRISKGFTKKMKSLLGGARSCAHLRELLEAMAPAIFQGVFTILSENDQSIRLREDPSFVGDKGLQKRSKR